MRKRAIRIISCILAALFVLSAAYMIFASVAYAAEAARRDETVYVDMDGDGIPERVQLQAEKGYFGNEEDSWYEAPEMGLNPYLLTVTKGNSQYLCPLGWELGDEQPLRPCYFSMAPSSPYGGAFWTQGRPGSFCGSMCGGPPTQTAWGSWSPP